jgi:hypothetical protein
MEQRNHADYLNLLRSQAQSHSRTQQSLYREKARPRSMLNKIAIFLSINIFAWAYHYFTSRFGKKHPFTEYTDPENTGVYQISNEVLLSIVADWATFTEQSAEIARQMKAGNPDYTVHLGDVYYVGAPQEVESNFFGEQSPWKGGSSGTLALPGNHEFYSNGNPYFNRLLKEMYVSVGGKRFDQQASFFCLENEHWRVIGLDTGYFSVGPVIIEFIFPPDAHLDDKLIAWLKNVVKLGDKADKRGLVLFSHHQYCSAFEGEFHRAAEQLQELIGPNREVIWIWGHEHRFAVYGKFRSEKGITAFGRCIGHGGMPVQLGKEFLGNKKLIIPKPEMAKASNLVFYDKREKKPIDGVLLGHNGFANLKFAGAELTIEHRDETDWLFRELWTVEPVEGKLSGRVQHNPAADLTLVAPDWDVAVKNTKDPQSQQ